MSIELLIEVAVRKVLREELPALFRQLQLGAGVDDVMTYAQAGAVVGYHVSTITKWVHDGLLPAFGRGKGKRVRRGDVLRALELSSTRKVEPTAQEIAENILSSKKVRRIR